MLPEYTVKHLDGDEGYAYDDTDEDSEQYEDDPENDLDNGPGKELNGMEWGSLSKERPLRRPLLNDIQIGAFQNALLAFRH